MALLRPFRALRPAPANAVRVASPPYDVINTAEARALAKGNADSFLRVSRPEIDLPEGTDEHDDRVYEQGRKNLEELVRRGVLRADPSPRFYVYAQRMGAHRQTGLVACASVEEYVKDVIKKHEKTRADKEDDRTRHIDTLSAHDEPVFLTYLARREVDAEVEAVKRGPPEYDLTTPDGVEHQLWVGALVAGARAAGELRREGPGGRARLLDRAGSDPVAHLRHRGPAARQGRGLRGRHPRREGARAACGRGGLVDGAAPLPDAYRAAHRRLG